jgi:hypothetical protein
MGKIKITIFFLSTVISFSVEAFYLRNNSQYTVCVEIVPINKGKRDEGAKEYVVLPAKSHVECVRGRPSKNLLTFVYLDESDFPVYMVPNMFVEERMSEKVEVIDVIMPMNNFNVEKIRSIFGTNAVRV